MNHPSRIIHSVRRFGRVVGAPFALFVSLATLLSGIGSVISQGRHGHVHGVASVPKEGKLPYEAPSFEVFAGVFSSNAWADEVEEGSM